MVLQRGASTQAAIYGSVSGMVSSATKVTLTVREDASTYDVQANIMQMGSGNLTWKGLLKPHPEYGGNMTVTASCSGCTGNTSVTISDLTFGDVWCALTLVAKLCYELLLVIASLAICTFLVFLVRQVLQRTVKHGAAHAARADTQPHVRSLGAWPL